MLLRSALLALSERRAIGDRLDRLGLTRRLVRRFVAGTTADEALAVIARQNSQGLKGAVTFLGENVRSETGALAATQEYVALLDELHARRLDAVPSLKPSQLGIDVSPEICRANVARVADKALAVDRLVWIDMEARPTRSARSTSTQRSGPASRTSPASSSRHCDGRRVTSSG